MQTPNFIEKAEQLAQCNLVFPYHIRHQDLLGVRYYNKVNDEFHEHSFEDVLRVIYDEPKAFYLTEEDKKDYSEQELRFIKRLQTARLN